MIGGGITGGENMWIKLQACRQKLSGRRLRQWGDSRPKYMGYTWSENYCSGASSFLGEILCRGSDHDERVATMAGEQALSMWRAQKLRMAAAPAIITTTTATTSSHNTSNIHNLNLHSNFLFLSIESTEKEKNNLIRRQWFTLKEYFNSFKVGLV